MFVKSWKINWLASEGNLAREKAEYAESLCEFLTTRDLDVLDLTSRLTEVTSKIANWNGMVPRWNEPTRRV